MNAYFEDNKNRTGGIEKPFYVKLVETSEYDYLINHHWHYHIELLYFPKGDGEVFTGNKFHNVVAGDLVFISPSEIHSVFVKSGIPTQHYIISFDPELLSPSPGLSYILKNVLPQVINLSLQQKALILNIPTLSDIPELIYEMHKEYESERVGYELIVTAGIYKLFSWIMRALSDNNIEITSNPLLYKNKTDALKNALEYIDQHFCEDISAKELTRISLMSYSYFSKLFKQMMHMPYKQYINYLRIRKAEQLLLLPDKSITDIAFDTGFSNPSYFIEQFKKVKGIPPKEYRKKIKTTELHPL